VAISLLDPEINIEEMMAGLDQMPFKVRMQFLNDVANLSHIYEYMGAIMRPNFEGGEQNRLVRKKYVPNTKHEQFYRNATLAPGRGRWLCGGNRSGKTESGCREDVAFSMGFRPFFDRSDPDYLTPIRPPTAGRIVVEDWEKAAKGTMEPKLFACIPPELIATKKKNQNGVYFFFEIKIPFDATKRVSTIEIVTNKSDPRALEGWRGDWLHFDEPPKRAVFTALTRGLVDTNGFFWMTLTPLEEPWILDEVVLNPAYLGDYVTSWENVYDPDTGSGFLTREGIENFASKLNSVERQARLYGEFSHLSGRIFSDFSSNVHVYPGEFVTVEHQPPQTWWRDVLLDPGRRKPHCVTFVAWSPEGDLFVYDGFRIGNTDFAGDFNDVIPAVPTYEELKWAILSRIGDGPKPNRLLIDSYAQEKDWLAGVSLFDKLSEDFPTVIWPKVKKYPNAITPLADLMKPSPINGRPRFFIHRSMTRAIWELDRYRWDNWSGRSNENKAPKDTPVKKDDDYVDCILAAALCPPPDMSHFEESTPSVYFDY
jgi:hypothetical protein